MRRTIALSVAAVLVASLVVTIGLTTPALSTPVAMTETDYLAYGRVFPDPHGCNAAGSPFAKGNVCATDFIQFEELESGMTLLEELFPRFVEFQTLDEDFDCDGKPVTGDGGGCKAFQSAGLPQSVTTDDQNPEAFSRDKQPLHMVRITDERVPDKGKEYFVFPLSIHGIERAGVEGGTRAAEDLATWAACELEAAPSVVDCDSEGPFPHPLLEATPKKSVTAGDALAESVIYFIYPNPDGWRRGERTNGPQFFQRYNGNGVDLNRDWPAQGYTFRPYTPLSEPESRSFAKVLQTIGPKDAKGNPAWAGGIDLHGQLVDRAFSFTLIGGMERPYDKNQRVLQTVKGAWRDAEKRLSWSPLIKPNDAPEDDPRVYGVQWGTIWDSIDYTVTGALGDWIDSPIGLNGDGLDNEMSLSHLSNCGVGTCFSQDAEQLHVDGNKSLIYSSINYRLRPENTTIRTRGRVGYIHNRGVVSAPTKRETTPPKFTRYPTQDDIFGESLNATNDYTYQFKVNGPKQKVYNGGLAAEITCANAQGVGPCALESAVLERLESEEPNVQGEEWEVVNSYYNQSPIYVQAGQALHANLPTPGQYRVRLDGESRSGLFNLDINFTKEKSWDDPGQIGYKVTNMKFWKMMKKYMRPGLGKLTPGEILGSSSWKREYDTIVMTNRFYKKLAPKLRKWVARFNGNLILTDAAMKMLPAMGIVKGAVSSTNQYAGYVNFQTARRESTYGDPLAAKINASGAAEGQSGRETRRRQTYEPVPLGIAIQTPDGDDANNSPVWSVAASDFKTAVGKQRATGTTGDTSRITYGQVRYRGGRIRFVGALLPMPTDKFDHPFGLANYALTYSGYQMLKNMMLWKN